MHAARPAEAKTWRIWRLRGWAGIRANQAASCPYPSRITFASHPPKILRISASRPSIRARSPWSATVSATSP